MDKANKSLNKMFLEYVCPHCGHTEIAVVYLNKISDNEYIDTICNWCHTQVYLNVRINSYMRY